MQSIIDRLNDTLAAKTQAALAQLVGLEGQIALAIEAATQAAQERIDARLAALDDLTAVTMLAFEDRLAEMAGQAMTRALNHLADRLGVAADGPQEQPVAAEEPEPTADETPPVLPMPVPVTAAEDPVVEAAPVPLPVAAQALEQPAVGVLPHDDHDDGFRGLDSDIPSEVGEDDYSGEPDAPQDDETPSTDDPAGLHTRTGEGKQARYHEVESPSPGETYYRRAGRRRWQAVRYEGS